MFEFALSVLLLSIAAWVIARLVTSVIEWFEDRQY